MEGYVGILRSHADKETQHITQTQESEPVLVTYTNQYGSKTSTRRRLLLRVGIKVVDEWLISLDYARSSNIYVRGYLDLRAWSLRLRT